MDTTTVNLPLSVAEAEALEALAAGIGVLAQQRVDTASAVVAAVEMGLTRLLEDFELPDPAVRDRIARARADVRAGWSRGDAHL